MSALKMLENRLEIDIGNTFCKWRVMHSESIVARGKLLTNDLLSTQLADIKIDDYYNKSETALCTKFNNNLNTCPDARDPAVLVDIPIHQASVCSVAIAECNDHLENQIKSAWGLQAKFFETQAKASGLTNSYSDPSKMGADRWLASIAAKHLYPGQMLCIADCGSAINIEFLSAKAEHLGGYIVPGLGLMAQSLLQNTARVTQTKPEADLKLGNDTASNVANGSLFAAVALLEKLQREMQACSGLLVIT
ncbi:MAG: type III pantothenate kinase, partial [Oceanospirillaceae bacterium]